MGAKGTDIPLAADLLNQISSSGSNSVTKSILQFTSTYLDAYDLAILNPRLVALVTVCFLAIIRTTAKKRGGVDWYALLHSIVSTTGAYACWHLDSYYHQAAEDASWQEPLRTISTCAPPMTTLHRVVPAITMGYSLFDLLDGLTLSVDFALHGAATLAVMAYFVENNIPQILAPMLLMEGSTSFLAVMKADFLPEAIVAINQGLFVVSFFIFRCVWTPILWSNIIVTMWAYSSTPEYKECYSSTLLPACFVFGMIFHCLNAFWFFKIVKKVQRKLSGEESVKENNDLVEKIDEKSGKED